MADLFRKTIDVLYWLYTWLYFPWALWIIRHSKLTIPPVDVIACDYFSEEDPTSGQCRHFLLVPIKAENRWLFWRRRFVFSLGNDRWFTMPSPVPCGPVANGYQKYELNARFVQTHMSHPDDDWLVQFLTWK